MRLCVETATAYALGNDNSNGSVSQLAEETDSKPVQCEFESHQSYCMRITYYNEGELPAKISRGDFLLSKRNKAFMGMCIRVFQTLKHPREFAQWSHAMLVVDSGVVQEALEFGQERNSLETYLDAELLHVEINADSLDVEQMMKFADSCYYHKRRYGYLTIVSLLISLVTGSALQFSMAGTAICSGFVAEALTRAGWIFEMPADYVKPADLASQATDYVR